MTADIGPNDSNLPPDKIFGFTTETDIVGKVQVVLPLDDLLVRLVGILGTEGRIACKGSCVSKVVPRRRYSETYRRGTHT